MVQFRSYSNASCQRLKLVLWFSYFTLPAILHQWRLLHLILQFRLSSMSLRLFLLSLSAYLLGIHVTIPFPWYRALSHYWFGPTVMHLL